MKSRLSKRDLSFILESLRYTRKAFEEYEHYPSYEYKQKRISEANDVISSVQDELRNRK